MYERFEAVFLSHIWSDTVVVGVSSRPSEVIWTDLLFRSDAGVAASSPEMVPEHQPTIDHFRANLKSSSNQDAAAKVAVRLEFQQAMTARKLARKEEPPLNPSYPNHSRTVPRRINETL